MKNPQPWRYLTGETRELLDDMPLLEALRDIVFLLKAFMAPTREHLPEEMRQLSRLPSPRARATKARAKARV